jgi:DHA2 family multidrug resistance protein-like MFS transporter
VLAVLCSSLLLVAMDATILNVALPSLVDDLAPDAIAQLWIIDIYGLILGGLLLTTGAAGDRWGRKRLFLAGVAVFGVASVIAALSHSTTQLIAGRVLLALGGALLMPSTLSLLRNVFTDARERTVAIGIWASVAGAGAAIGPVLGGFLVQHFGWQAAFWVNVPIVVAALVAGAIILPESRNPSGHGIDWFDAGLSIVGMITLVWGIKHLFKDGLLSPAPVALVVGAAILWWFFHRQKSHPDPMLDVNLFRNKPFRAAAISILTAMMAIGAALFLITLWLQYVEGYSPMAAGVRMLPAALSLLFGALSASWLIRRLGVKTVLGLGLGGLVLAFAALAVLPLHYPLVALAQVAFGLGDGLAVTASTSVMVSAAPPERAGMAAAVEETCYELGIGLGVALLGTISATAYRYGLQDLGLPEPQASTVDESIGGAHEVAANGYPQVLDSAKQAFVDSITTTSIVSAVLVAVAALLALRLIPRGFQADASH